MRGAAAFVLPLMLALAIPVDGRSDEDVNAQKKAAYVELQRSLEVSGAYAELLNALRQSGDVGLTEVLAHVPGQGVPPLHHYQSPVKLAALRGDAAEVRMLLERDLAPYAEGVDGALLEAADRGEAEAVRLLLRTGMAADGYRDLFGQTPLMLAAGADSPEAVSALLEHGADANGVDESLETALHSAARRGSTEAIRLLLEAGANAEAVSERGVTPLDFAAWTGTPEQIALLVRAGTLNHRSADGFTPLITAILHDQTGNAVTLLRAGADPNVAAEGGRTPLMLATALGQVEVVILLLDAGADPAATNHRGQGLDYYLIRHPVFVTALGKTMEVPVTPEERGQIDAAHAVIEAMIAP